MLRPTGDRSRRCQSQRNYEFATHRLASTRYQRRNRVRRGTALSELRFLCVVGAKLRTEVFAVRRPPNFNMTIPKKERLVAERTTGEIAVLEVVAARDHRRPIPFSKQGQLEYFVVTKFSCR